jgi:Holliday junction DNA helicase RuvB
LQSNSIRPSTLDTFVGQSRIKNNLRLYIQSAQMRRAVLDHTLFYGPPGLGKTTLARIIAEEMKANIIITAAPNIDNVKELAGVLTKLNDGDVLFIDEIHRLSANVEESIYSAMEDYAIDVIVGRGRAAHSERVELPRFTLVGATTKFGNLSDPLRDRFGIVEKLEYYTDEQLAEVALQTASSMGIQMDKQSALTLGIRSRGTPRIVKKLTSRVRDFALVEGKGFIDNSITMHTMNELSISDTGLNEADKDYLYGIIDKFNGGPVGVEAIAAAIGEDKRTIKEVYEPFLLASGFIDYTKRGRIVTDKGYSAVGLVKPIEGTD